MTRDGWIRLADLGRLLCYPTEGYGGDVGATVAALAAYDAGAEQAMAAFAAFVGETPVTGMQEAFTQTFDLNPVCALEVGWQLFGEEYERGGFLVETRDLLRQHGIDEGSELPDHLASLLAVLPHLPEEHARQLATGALVPAVRKMAAAIEASASPFCPVIQTIDRLLAVVVAAHPEVSHA